MSAPIAAKGGFPGESTAADIVKRDPRNELGGVVWCQIGVHFTFLTTMARLGVNIDHVATVRQARRTVEPDPVWAAALAELGGADLITVHLREDRRHIQDRDVRVLRETVQVKLNLEMAAAEEITAIAVDIKPHQCTLVPEKRQEVTTEGGLDVVGQLDRVRTCVNRLRQSGIEVSLFIDADEAQVDASRDLGVQAVEFHTGRYADAPDERSRLRELETLRRCANFASKEGLVVHMGHGLTYRNVVPVARIAVVSELNIGHSIVARAVMVGFQQAVREMKQLVTGPFE
jgi:pyridoxine 5-phosphate synthase